MAEDILGDDAMHDWLAIHVALGTAVFSEMCAIIFLIGHQKDMPDAALHYAQDKKDRRDDAGGATNGGQEGIDL